MPSLLSTRYEKLLRHRLDKLFKAKGPSGAIFAVLSEWEKNDWHPYLFGGLLRDILVFGIRNYPRDVDIVLANGSIREIERKFQHEIRRKTRFGGVQLELRRWHFDVWPLEMTWAFLNNKSLEPTPANLPKTTFLNVEAIAVSIERDGSIGNVFD